MQKANGKRQRQETKGQRQKGGDSVSGRRLVTRGERQRPEAGTPGGGGDEEKEKEARKKKQNLHTG